MRQAEQQAKPGTAGLYVPENYFDVICVGGGLAGLTASLLLAKQNKKVLVIEKKIYPFHKVCGEYISNEVLHFLITIGLDPFAFGASSIGKLRISAHNGKNFFIPLDTGGFALSRYVFDHQLSLLAARNGTEIITGTRVTDINRTDGNFHIVTDAGIAFTAKIVIGAYGKRDLLDKKLDRSFIRSHTGYAGVKYHIQTNYPEDEIGLDLFQDGYCGIVKIEEDKYNLCYLYNRSAGKFKSIRELEEKVLYKNPVIKKIFESSHFLFDDPEVINEISFAPKKLVENHILMCGDTAGLITPLCGNGMSMAMHGAKILAEEILVSGILNNSPSGDAARHKLEENYYSRWHAMFARRLYWGRKLQALLAGPFLGVSALHIMHTLPFLEKWVIRNTHGETIL